MVHNGVVMSNTLLKDLPPRLQDRYGYKKTSKLVIAFGVLLAMVVIALGALTTWRFSHSELEAKLLAWSAPAADHVNITFEINRDASQSVQCVLRAQNHNFHDIGYATTTIPPGKSYVQETYQLATTEKAYSGQLLGCSVDGLPLVAPPSFPPGKSNPPQPWQPSQD